MHVQCTIVDLRWTWGSFKCNAFDSISEPQLCKGQLPALHRIRSSAIQMQSFGSNDAISLWDKHCWLNCWTPEPFWLLAAPVSWLFICSHPILIQPLSSSSPLPFSDVSNWGWQTGCRRGVGNGFIMLTCLQIAHWGLPVCRMYGDDDKRCGIGSHWDYIGENRLIRA